MTPTTSISVFKAGFFMLNQNNRVCFLHTRINCIKSFYFSHCYSSFSSPPFSSWNTYKYLIRMPSITLFLSKKDTGWGCTGCAYEQKFLNQWISFIANKSIHLKCMWRSSHHGSVVVSLTSIYEDSGSIPGLTQWVKDLTLLLLWAVV